MQNVPVEQLKTNMKLGCRVRNKNGTIVAEAGSLVTNKLISQCFTMGIYALPILGTTVDNFDQSYDAKQRLKRVPHLFRNYQQSLFMRTLEKFLIKHFNERV